MTEVEKTSAVIFTPNDPIENALPNGEATVTHDRDWTWVNFPSKPAQSTIDNLKSQGARWSKRRGSWYFRTHIERAQLAL